MSKYNLAGGDEIARVLNVSITHTMSKKYKMIVWLLSNEVTILNPRNGDLLVTLIVKAKRLNPKKLGKTLKLTALTIATQLPGIINGFKSLFGRGITMGGIAAYQPPLRDLFNDSLYTRCSECGTRIFNGKTPASGGNIFGDIMDGVSRVADIAAKIVPLFGRGLISKKSDFNSGGRLW